MAPTRESKKVSFSLCVLVRSPSSHNASDCSSRGFCVSTTVFVSVFCAEVLLLTWCEGLPDLPQFVVLMQAASAPLVLVTGAAGGPQGATGRVLSHLLLERGVKVRALVRTDDDRAAALRAVGAEVCLTTFYATRLPPARGSPLRRACTASELCIASGDTMVLYQRHTSVLSRL